MKALVIDNYDSFTYNLVHMLRDLGVEVDVRRNNKVELDVISGYDRVIISPGPGLPTNAGSTMDIIAACENRTPLLGICLGHQAIATHLGGSLNNMSRVFHGVRSTIQRYHGSLLFQGVPEKLQVGRYHSWEVVESSLPSNVQVTARDRDQGVMAIECPARKLFGVQFHPESIMTEHGETMIKNFLKIGA